MQEELVKIFLKVVADPKIFGRMCEVFGEMPNIEFPTMGGLFFWDTLAEGNGYKLQKNKVFGHCRILNSEDIRIAWGSESSMIEKLKKISGNY